MRYDAQKKHIPKLYLENSKEIRLKVLAGLIDTDGHMASPTKYEVVQKNTRLARDIVTLARSLGFYTTIDETTKQCPSTSRDGGVFTGQYWRIHISIDQVCPEIPIKVDRKRFDLTKVRQWDNPKIDLEGNPQKRLSGRSGTQWTKEMEDELLRQAHAHGKRKQWQKIGGPLLQDVSSAAKKKKYAELSVEPESSS